MSFSWKSVFFVKTGKEVLWEIIPVLGCGSFFYILRIKLHIKLVLCLFPIRVSYMCLPKEDVYIKEKNGLVR